MTLATSTYRQTFCAHCSIKRNKKRWFCFFYKLRKQKGKQIDENPFVSLVFFWKELERQVRIEGEIKKISDEESDEYFSKRPLESRIGAWSSPQSEVIENREILEKNVSDYTNKFKSQHIPRPPHWGGYIVNPTLIEFWQAGQAGFMIVCNIPSSENNVWKIERLAP